VIDASGEETCVSAKTLEGVSLRGYTRVLFKTRNSYNYGLGAAYLHRFIYLEKNACDILVENGVKTVGFDYITIDPIDTEDYPAHRTLLGNGTCVIEGIDLSRAEAGEYFLVCLPLKLLGTDGANARAVLIGNGYRP
jgi:arylformamidase